MQEEIDALKRALSRERSARKFAEKTLEDKSSELFMLNQELKLYTDKLEDILVERTQEAQRIARFPDENPSPVVRFTKECKLEYYNSAAKSVIQIQAFFDFVNQFVTEVFLMGATIIRELHLDNVIYSVTIVPILDEGYVNFYFSNVTKERLFTTKLEQSEEKYRSVIENMQLGLLEVDNDNKITKAYNQFCVFSGYEEAEIIGKRAIDVFTRDDDVRQVINEERVKRKEGEGSVYELKLIKKDGTEAWVMISGAPLFNDEGEVVGSIGIHLDISKKKHIEVELRGARLKAEESSRSKELFLANMSHEIRTPIHAIIGMSDLLLKTNLSPSQYKMMNAVSVSSQNLLVIINDILDLTKVDSGKMQLECIGFNLHDQIQHIVRTNELKAQVKDLLFNTVIKVPKNYVLLGDPFRLTQILLNLTSNAIKFTTVGLVELSVVSEQLDNNNIRCVFKVKDTGKGIRDDLVAHVFESFAQEDESISRNFGGTGLGLSITKKLVELQGGEIKVESKLGEGSVFSFYIDYALGTESDLTKDVVDDLDYTQLKGLKVLLAEDNVFNQTLIENLFLEYSVDLTITNNGEEVLEELNKRNFDIVLMDIQMPIMDGVEATEYIRKNTQWNDLPILALTANAFQNELEKYLDYGMNDYLSKPFQPYQLYVKILTLTGRLAKEVKVLGEHPAEGHEVEKGDEELFSLSKLVKMSGGGQDFIDKMIVAFTEHIPKVLVDLDNASREEDWGKVGALCHRLKASLNLLAVDSLAEDLLLLETEPDSFSKEVKHEKVNHILEVTNKVLGQLN